MSHEIGGGCVWLVYSVLAYTFAAVCVLAAAFIW
jgi:hypothetical protein